MTLSKAMADQVAAIPHLNKHEIADLRSDVDVAFSLLEAQTGYPVITRVATGHAIDISVVGGGYEAHNIVGTGFMQSATQAVASFGATTKKLTFTANRPGTGGNAISVELEDGAAEAISVVGTVVTVTLNTGTSTANSVKALCDADASFKKLLSVVSGGAGIVDVADATLLTGGTGTDLVVKVGGLAQAVLDKVTDVLIPMGVTDLTGLAATDSVNCEVICNGVKSAPASVGLIA